MKNGTHHALLRPAWILFRIAGLCLILSAAILCKPKQQTYGLCPDLNAATPRPVWTDQPGWLPYTSTGCTEMSRAWKGIEIDGQRHDLKGCNYYVTGTPQPGNTYSSRFDADSDYYQAWFGAYIVPPMKNGQRVPHSVINQIGTRDIKAWSIGFGDPHPKGDMVKESTKCIAPPVISDPDSPDCVKWRVETVLDVHVDTGKNNPQTNFPPLWIIPPEAWNKLTDSYQDAVQTPIVNEIHYLADGTMVASYYSGIVLDFRNGQTFQTPAKVMRQTVIMNDSLKVLEAGSPYNCPGNMH